MIQASGVIICLSYIFGLLSTAIPGGGVWMLVLAIAGAVMSNIQRQTLRKPKIASDINRRKSPTTKHQNPSTLAPIPYSPTPPASSGQSLSKQWLLPTPKVWLIAGVVGLLASFYLQSRVPQPGNNDISKFVPPEENSNHQEQLFIVRGEVTSSPRLTRSQKAQFWLAAAQLDQVKNDTGKAGITQGVTGKLYVTVPLLEATGLHPGQQIAVTGVLYKPKLALNPGAFDFQQFLHHEGAFAGMSGRRVSILDEEHIWGLWKVRQRIVRAQIQRLGIPEGTLLSAMTLGTKIVDLPYDVRDLFVRVGLAHALAGPGLKTSLILAFVVTLTRGSTRVTQVTLGCISLILFLALTGFQPTVLKAVIMGFAALIGIGLRRKVKKLGALLLAAVILLLFNPLWVWDLGFQLSFLATLGLIVTVSSLIQHLDWLPPTIASLIAVPLAATIWTLPLLLHVFSVVALYCVPLGVLASPFISIITVGGIVSAVTSLVLPDAGSAVASFFYCPTHLLIQLVNFVAALPGSSVAVGSISTLQMIAVYTLLFLTWLIPWWQKRWLFAGLIAIGLVLIPAWHNTNNLFRITVLAANDTPVVIIQDRSKLTLINSGDESVGRNAVLPFLQQQGVNQIDWAIATDFSGNGSNSWLELIENLPIKVFYNYALDSENALVSIGIQKEILNRQGIYQPLAVGQTINTGTTVAQLIDDQLPILQMQVLGQNWLMVGNLKPDVLSQLLKKGRLPHPQVLWCLGQSLKELVLTLQPQVVIASSSTLDAKTASQLGQIQTKVFITGQDGAIQWTPDGQFESFTQITENKTSIF
jgi:competence protein ComEC